MTSEQCGSPHKDLYPNPDVGGSASTYEAWLGTVQYQVAIHMSRGKGQDSITITEKEDVMGRRGTHTRLLAGSVETLLQITGHFKSLDPRCLSTVF